MAVMRLRWGRCCLSWSMVIQTTCSKYYILYAQYVRNPKIICWRRFESPFFSVEIHLPFCCGMTISHCLSPPYHKCIWCASGMGQRSTMYMYALSVLFPLLVLQTINFEHLITEGQFLSNSSTVIFDLHFGLLGSCRLGFTGSSVSMTLIHR